MAKQALGRAEYQMWHFEQLSFEAGFGHVVGIDEAGRGPLAGPVVAACVQLNARQLNRLEGLTDSKKLSERQRTHYANLVREHASAFGIGMASVAEIDELNILQATFLAMRRALAQVEGVDHVLVDGNRLIAGITISQTAIVRGDGKSYSIAAASVLAKVTRDHYMIALAQRHPGYGFERHKGYPTRAHYEAIARLGVTPDHRRSFLKS